MLPRITFQGCFSRCRRQPFRPVLSFGSTEGTRHDLPAWCSVLFLHPARQFCIGSAAARVAWSEQGCSGCRPCAADRHVSGTHQTQHFSSRGWAALWTRQIDGDPRLSVGRNEAGRSAVRRDGFPAGNDARCHAGRVQRSRSLRRPGQEPKSYRGNAVMTGPSKLERKPPA